MHGKWHRVGVFCLASMVTAGWVPSAVAQEFRRGDANADGEVDLSDGSRTLGHLFLGQLAPPCLDAADADDSGELELTDAVFTFAHLFLGGPPPAPPGPDACGADPSEDALGCDAFPACDGPDEASFVFSPAGGEFTTPTGITLIVPPGAVEADTEVTIAPLPEALEAALNDGFVFSTHERRLLGGFAGAPDGLTFAVPITVRMSAVPLRPGGLPVAASFDLETLETTIEASTLRWLGDEGIVEFEVSHFSGAGAVEVVSNDGELQVVEGSEVPVDAPCRDVQVTVINSAEDRAVSRAATDCQAISDFLLVVLDACGGQQERHLVSVWDCEIQIEAEQEDNEISVGHETKLSARVFFTDFPEIEVRLPLTWENQTPGTASFVPESDGFITGSGTLTGLKPGGASVGVRAPDPELSLLLGVLVNEVTFEIPSPTIDVAQGKSRPLEVQTLDIGGNVVDCPLVWKSADETIATVNSAGVVQGEMRGETEIRVHPTDADACPGGCGTITVNVIRNVEGTWQSTQTVTIELVVEEGPDLTGTCELTSDLGIRQNGRDACGAFITTGTCTVPVPDADPIVIEINESGQLAGLIAEDDTFSYCSEREEGDELCIHSSGMFLSDDSVSGDMTCKETDPEIGVLSRTQGGFTAERLSPEVPAMIGACTISGEAAIAACQ